MEDYILQSEGAKKLGVSGSTFIKWIKEGRLEKHEVKLGKNKTVTLASFEELKESDFFQLWKKGQKASKNGKKENHVARNFKEEIESSEILKQILNSIGELSEEVKQVKKMISEISTSEIPVESSFESIQKNEEEKLSNGLTRKETLETILAWKSIYKFSAKKMEPSRAGTTLLNYINKGKELTNEKLLQIYQTTGELVSFRTRSIIQEG